MGIRDDLTKPEDVADLSGIATGFQAGYLH